MRRRWSGGRDGNDSIVEVVREVRWKWRWGRGASGDKMEVRRRWDDIRWQLKQTWDADGHFCWCIRQQWHLLRESAKTTLVPLASRHLNTFSTASYQLIWLFKCFLCTTSRQGWLIVYILLNYCCHLESSLYGFMFKFLLQSCSNFCLYFYPALIPLCNKSIYHTNVFKPQFPLPNAHCENFYLPSIF